MSAVLLGGTACGASVAVNRRPTATARKRTVRRQEVQIEERRQDERERERRLCREETPSPEEAHYPYSSFIYYDGDMYESPLLSVERARDGTKKVWLTYINYSVSRAEELNFQRSPIIRVERVMAGRGGYSYRVLYTPIIKIFEQLTGKPAVNFASLAVRLGPYGTVATSPAGIIGIASRVHKREGTAKYEGKMAMLAISYLGNERRPEVALGYRTIHDDVAHPKKVEETFGALHDFMKRNANVGMKEVIQNGTFHLAHVKRQRFHLLAKDFEEVEIERVEVSPDRSSEIKMLSTPGSQCNPAVRVDWLEDIVVLIPFINNRYPTEIRNRHYRQKGIRAFLGVEIRFNSEKILSMEKVTYLMPAS